MASGEVVPSPRKPQGPLSGSAIDQNEEVGPIQGATKSQEVIRALSRHYFDISSQ